MADLEAILKNAERCIADQNYNLGQIASEMGGYVDLPIDRVRLYIVHIESASEQPIEQAFIDQAETVCDLWVGWQSNSEALNIAQKSLARKSRAKDLLFVGEGAHTINRSRVALRELPSRRDENSSNSDEGQLHSTLIVFPYLACRTSSQAIRLRTTSKFCID